MEDNRINRRVRPRPYDLRRKVLLKNFLREQMTQIPFVETSEESSSQTSNFSNELSLSVGFDEDLPELNEDALEPTTSEKEQSDPILNHNLNSNSCATSLIDGATNIKDDLNNNELPAKSSNEPTLLKIANLVKFKEKPKKKLKSMFKARATQKNSKISSKPKPFKTGFERIFPGRKKSNDTSQNEATRKSPRSLFSLFKQRKEQRKANLKETTKTNTSSKFNTSQSSQTDDSWAREELARVKQSNKRLQEENRLLSESLSYFMSNASMDPQVKPYNLPLQSLNKNRNTSVFPDYFVQPPNSVPDNNWNPRSRVTRSKSVQEYERRNIPRNIYRTRSINYHHYRSNNDSSGRDVHRSANGIQAPSSYVQRERRKGTLNLPFSNTLRGIQRRSSMPERPLSENVRSGVHRSDSLRSSYNTGRPYHHLPSDAFY